MCFLLSSLLTATFWSEGRLLAILEVYSVTCAMSPKQDLDKWDVGSAVIFILLTIQAVQSALTTP